MTEKRRHSSVASQKTRLGVEGSQTTINSQHSRLSDEGAGDELQKSHQSDEEVLSQTQKSHLGDEGMVKVCHEAQKLHPKFRISGQFMGLLLTQNITG